MANLTLTQLKKLAPYGNEAILKNTVIAFNEYADELGINKPLRKAHFLAQLAHESAGFRTTKEYGGPSKRYAPWYGRGLIQTTWQENYAEFYEWCVKEGFQDVPEFFTAKGREEVARFPWAFLCAIWYWESRNLNELADEDNVRAITKKINGGYNGLDDRIMYLNKAKKIFNVKINDTDAPSGTLVGDFTAEDVQKALVKRGYKVTVDGKIGPKTISAIKMFQKTNGLVPDGLVGPKTAKVLFS